MLNVFGRCLGRCVMIWVLRGGVGSLGSGDI